MSLCVCTGTCEGKQNLEAKQGVYRRKSALVTARSACEPAQAHAWLTGPRQLVTFLRMPQGWLSEGWWRAKCVSVGLR